MNETKIDGDGVLLALVSHRLLGYSLPIFRLGVRWDL